MNKNGYDFGESYDILPSFITGKTLKYSQLICLKEIVAKYGVSIFQDYKNKYINSYDDEESHKIVKTFIEQLKLETFPIEEKDLNELQFQDINSKIMTFKELLNSNAEKIVYLYFWASWCVPCRQAMSASKKLRAEYANKDIELQNG